MGALSYVNAGASRMGHRGSRHVHWFRDIEPAAKHGGPPVAKEQRRAVTLIIWRMSLRALSVVTVLCVVASAGHGQTPASVARGHEIAERACGGCHAMADRPGGTAAAPSLRAIAGRSNQTPERLQSFIMTPHRPMPGIPLSLAEVNDVVAYILSLK
jgi:mono/diheme cytochrome c family protein